MWGVALGELVERCDVARGWGGERASPWHGEANRQAMRKNRAKVLTISKSRVP